MNKNLRTFPLIAFSVLILVSGSLFAQKPKGKTKKEFAYAMVGEGGTNASAVAWDSKKSAYVTVIAGNESFPREVFDSKGKNLAQSEAGFDWRGLWYNSATGEIEGNGPGEAGWATFTLDDEYNPGDVSDIAEGEFEPEFQAVGTYNSLLKQVVFFDYAEGALAMYARNDPDQMHEVALEWSDVSSEDLNGTTVGYTGHQGYDYVFLDFNNNKLVFFDGKGKHTASTKLPKKGAPVNDSFAFSFANNRAFLYDKDARIWYAYKVF